MIVRRHLLLVASLLTLPLIAQADTKACLDAFGFASSLDTIQTRFPLQKPKIDMDKLLNIGQRPQGLSQSTALAADQLAEMVYVNYGPRTYNAQYLKLDFETWKTDLKRDALRIKTTNEGYLMLTEALMKFKDSHVSTQNSSSLVYHNPVQFRAAEGRLIVHQRIDKFYPANERKIEQGDEVLAINGKSPREFVNTFGAWSSIGNRESSLAEFAIGFPNWKEARGIPLSNFATLSKEPKYAHINDTGLKLKIQAKDGGIFEVNLPFTKEGVGLVDQGFDGNKPQPTVIGDYHTKDDTNPFKSLAPETEKLFGAFHELVNLRLPTAGSDEPDLLKLGAQKPFFKLPPDFKRIELPVAAKALGPLLSDEVIFAGSYMHNGERVGFLRMGSYAPKNLIGTITVLRYMVARLQAESDYLVVDQTDNPGGYVILSDIFLKTFTGGYDKSKHLMFNVKPTAKFISQYLTIKSMVQNNPDGLFSPEEVKTMVADLDRDINIMQSSVGNDLTPPVSMLTMSRLMERAIDRALQKSVKTQGLIQGLLARFMLGTPGEITPATVLTTVLGGVDVSKATYYKKDEQNYMVINELDFSGGDATPAGLQDYGAMKLIGNDTNGAGGSVGEFKLEGTYSMTVHLTESLMHRQNRAYPFIEKARVQADIKVPLLVSDIKSGYTTYLGRLHDAIDKDRAMSKLLSKLQSKN